MSSGSNPWSKENGGDRDGIGPNSNCSGRTAAGHALVLNREKETAEIEWTGQKSIGTTKYGQPATTWTEIIREWPKSTLFIVCNEFCERFSYYGMRTVLTLYFLNVLKYSANTATMMFNGFTVLCYFTPLLGSILADGYIGKFKTIFFVSLLYTIGQWVLCLASVQNSASSFHPWLDILGLFIIGMGTGGIKPCVCSFGGDQFEPYQQKMLSLFFSLFYFSINAGSMISTFVSPLFRASPCLGQDSCYPMAFGIPAALMVLSTILFMSASCWYKKPPPPTENIFREVYKIGKKAVANKWRNDKGNNPPHWLDYYFDTHVCIYDSKCCQLRSQQSDPKACQKRQFVTDVKCLLRLLVVYLPAPMFWALYDQQGSRWLIQSVMMDGRLWGDTLLLPDQIMTLNAVLILLFIPMFQAFVYPTVSLCIKITPLRKMVAGGMLAAFAFVLSAIVQFKVNTTLPDIPVEGHAFMSGMNAFDNCTLNICATNGNCRTLEPNGTLTNTDRERPELFELVAGLQSWQINGTGNCGAIQNMEVEQMLHSGSTYWMMVGPMGVLFGEADSEKPKGGMGEFRVGFTLALEDIEYQGNLALCRQQPAAGYDNSSMCDPRRAEDFVAWQVEDGELKAKSAFITQDGLTERHAAIYEFKSVRPGRWKLFLMSGRPKVVGQETMSKGQLSLNETGIELEVRAQGGVYMIALTGNLSAAADQMLFPEAEKRVFQVVPDNSLSILWQIPQIMVITAAEILFSVTGYEFAYSQAAPSMKSLVQALWLMTTAIGDIIILLITLIAFPNLAVEFLFYAAGMTVVIGILALLAIFYYEYNNNYMGADICLSAAQFEGDGGKKQPLAGNVRSVQMYGTTEESIDKEKRHWPMESIKQ